MFRFFRIVVLVIFFKFSADGNPDLTPEAITVYRNPEFFKNLNYGTKINYNAKSASVPEAGAHQTDETPKPYKYPGETKKPNPPLASPGFEINYDNSPEFHHEPREIFVDTIYKPTRKKGPYSPKYTKKHSNQHYHSKVQKPVQEEKSEEEDSKESNESESVESDSGEPKDFVSVFNENPDEEFRSYHEPILLARPNFDLAERSGIASNNYNQPYPYNRTSPILYEDWKHYNYPKIHANEHLKSDSKLYSEEPGNSFEDESPSYYRDDETEDSSNLFEIDEFKNLGADTKHIYKKLLKPKKSFLFKFHSKPKLKKLKFKLKKKHLHDWFTDYPFDF